MCEQQINARFLGRTNEKVGASSVAPVLLDHFLTRSHSRRWRLAWQQLSVEACARWSRSSSRDASARRFSVTLHVTPLTTTRGRHRSAAPWLLPSDWLPHSAASDQIDLMSDQGVTVRV